jgi:hypothetical protein
MPIGIYKRKKGRIYGMKGHYHTKKIKIKISKTFKKNYKKENHPFYNKHHSEETKKKMSKNRTGKQKAEKNPAWKGNNVGNVGLHRWLRKNKPKSKVCEFCKNKKKFEDLEIANITRIYNRDFSNYKWACNKCHKKLDFPNGLIGKNLRR